MFFLTLMSLNFQTEFSFSFFFLLPFLSFHFLSSSLLELRKPRTMDRVNQFGLLPTQLDALAPKAQNGEQILETSSHLMPPFDLSFWPLHFSLPTLLNLTINLSQIHNSTMAYNILGLCLLGH